MAKQKVKIEDLCSVLEMPLRAWTLTPDMHPEEARIRLAAFKLFAKDQRNILAKRYHPDMPKGDIEKMAEVNAMYDVVKELEITIKQVKPRPTVVHFRTFSGSVFTNSSSSSTFTMY